MLCIFMLSLGTHAFNARWLMHDFNAGSGGEPVAMQATQDEFKGAASASGSLSNAEHKLLHSTDPAQPLLLAFIPDGMHDLIAGVLHFPAGTASIIAADSEPPFRPPQSPYRA